MPGQDFKLVYSTLVVKITKHMTISDDYWWFCATPCLRHSMITPLIRINLNDKRNFVLIQYNT